jgi:hypothetical protein
MTTEKRHTDANRAQRANRPNEPADGTTAANTPDATMRDVSHTNPHTNESMGSLFEHGVTIVADGGKRGAVDVPDTDEEADEETEAESEEDGTESGTEMRDVSHEAPEGGHGNRMFERVGKAEDVPDDAEDDDGEDEPELATDDEREVQTDDETDAAAEDESAAKPPVEAADE